MVEWHTEAVYSRFRVERGAWSPPKYPKMQCDPTQRLECSSFLVLACFLILRIRVQCPKKSYIGVYVGFLD